MLKRIALVVSIAALASTATIASAAGKGKPVRAKPYNGPLLKVTPQQGKPGAPLTVSGTKFAAGKTLHAEIDCPMFGRATHGSWSYKVKTDSKGSFVLRSKVPALKKARSGECNVYVLNTPTRAGSFWVSTGFRVS